MRIHALRFVLVPLLTAGCSSGSSDAVNDSLGSQRDATTPERDAADEEDERDAGTSAPSDLDAELTDDAGDDEWDDASGADADLPDADEPDASTCNFGSAVSGATATMLDVFGEVSAFAGGADLPSGRYRVTYLDGCMKYSSSQDWTVNAYADGTDAWWIVGADASQRIAVAPGTSGYAVANGAFAGFDECVAANLLVAPIEFEHAGGPLGIVLVDSPFSDNLAGTDGRNPSYRLEGLSACLR